MRNEAALALEAGGSGGICLMTGDGLVRIRLQGFSEYGYDARRKNLLDGGVPGLWRWCHGAGVTAGCLLSIVYCHDLVVIAALPHPIPSRTRP